MRPLSLLALLALAACDAAPPSAHPRASLPDDAAPPPPAPLPGPELLRVSDRDVDIGHRFSAAAPLRIDLVVPVAIPGRGLPPDASRRGPLDPGYPAGQEQSVIQLEIPTSPSNETDEERELASIGQFDPPRLCKVSGRCLWGPDDDGRWRAWRLRATPTGTRVEEIQLAHAWISPSTSDPNYTVITAWLPAGQAFQPGERILFSYVGDAPRRSTDWLSGDGAELKPRLRYRPAPVGPTDCPAADPSCWTELDPSDVQGIRLHPGAPAFLQVVAPLDVSAGAPFPVSVRALDRFANPAWATAAATLLVDGAPVAPANLSDDWRADATVPGLAAGLHELSLTTPAGLTVVSQWVGVGDGWARKVGDVHVHTGLEADTGFERGGSGGDHRGNFTRGWDALRYLREVAGHDFGALAEHAVQPVGWAPSSPAPDFQPGGPCEISDAPPPGVRPDWWQASQQIVRDFGIANPDFTTFPAFEWHGSLYGSGHAAALHRVVLYRDHRPSGHAMLPATQENRLPACLFRYLDANGYDPSQALVIPHMMYPNPDNDDWDLTYRPPPAALDSTESADRYQRVGEIFSSRAYATPAEDRLRVFEGAWTGTGADQPYTFRHAWRDLGVVIGVIGSSDSHTQMPGGDDPVAADRQTPSHAHEPAGAAFVLADPARPTRDGVYEALHDRRAYATSGIRAWLDLSVTADGVTLPMGSELTTSACTVTLRYDLATPGPVRRAAVWTTAPETAVPWQTVDLVVDGVNRRVTRTITLTNPVGRRDPPKRRMVYLQAEVGETPLSGDAEGLAPDAVWSSPVWITWTRGACGS